QGTGRERGRGVPRPRRLHHRAVRRHGADRLERQEPAEPAVAAGEVTRRRRRHPRAHGVSAPDTLRLITFTPPVVLAVAQARGQLAAEGLRVEHTITRSSAQLMHGVIDGTYEIGFTNPDNWVTYVTRDGADVFMFQGVVTGGERTLVVRPEIQSA